MKGTNEQSEEDGVQELLDLALQAYMQVLNEYTLADIARDARATPNVE